MTIVDHDTTTPQGVLDAVRGSLPTIAGRAAEIEAGPPGAARPARRADRAPAASGCCCRPATAGSAPTCRGDAGVRGARPADASVGLDGDDRRRRLVDLAGLPRATFDALLRRRATSSSPAPSTRPARSRPSTAATGCTGRWGFASGCEHADVVVRQLRRGHRRRRAAAADGGVLARRGRDRGHLERRPGCRGTGSHHFRVDDVVVPAERTLRSAGRRAVHRRADRPHPAAGADLARRSPASRSASRRARSTTSSTLAAARCRLLAHAPLAANPLFQFELATADTELACRSGAAVTRPPDGVAGGGRRGRRSRSSSGRGSGPPRCGPPTRAAAVVSIAYRCGRRQRGLRRVPAAAPPPRHPRRRPSTSSSSATR